MVGWLFTLFWEMVRNSGGQAREYHQVMADLQPVVVTSV
ncbi:hypothetical protein AKN40_1732 [Escherichia coli]|nr:hypothetical protein AKN40_1732 [Escherichia coli]